MARRGNAAEAAPDTTETAEAVSTEATATDAAPAASTEEVYDLTEFEAAVSAAIESGDKSTGELPAESVAAVNAAYAAIKPDSAGKTVKPRNKAKAVLQAGVKEGMNTTNIQLARGYMQLLDNLSAGATKKAPVEKVPANPTESFVEAVTAAQVAYQLLTTNVPEGVDEGWADKVTELSPPTFEQASALRTWSLNDAEDKGDEPEVSNIAKAAFKLSQGKGGRVRSASTSTFTGERRDIAKHVVEAFADKESGTFLTVAEIRAAKTAEYGDDKPSAGAISIRLFPKGGGACTIEGVTPGTNSDGNKGATKN